MLRLLIFVLIAGFCHADEPTQNLQSAPKILTRKEWKAADAVGKMKEHTATFITIHHTATKQKPNVSLAQKLQSLQKFSQHEGELAGGKKKPAWPDVPYHFYVACNGDIGEGRDIDSVGDTNTEYDPTGHILVTLEGNFEEEQPTPEQFKATRQLVAWLANKYHVPAEKIRSHKDYAKTRCPGKNLYVRLGELRP
ncbi:MAG: N-acetylmuramoyl-L-alanine amidase [Verrucomicrobiales bacterium]|nr:N-acetylmuramoyl-L-alanine amidase [Verrucomicrobiales bacterium]